MRIVMDDVGDIPAELVKKYNISVLPVNIMFGTEQFLSGVEMTPADFYEKTKQVTAVNFPKTSQPTPFQFVACYEEVFAEGETEIMAVTVSQKLSGTHESAVIAHKELEGRGTYHLFDSQAGSAAQGFMALEAARMAHTGSDAATILAKLHKMRDEMAVIFTIDSLEYAVKGGRVSTAQISHRLCSEREAHFEIGRWSDCRSGPSAYTQKGISPYRGSNPGCCWQQNPSN